MPTIAEQPHVAVRLVDASGSTAELRVHVKREASTPAAKQAAGDLLFLAGEASSCSPVEWKLRYPHKLTGEAPPAAGATVVHVGVLVFATNSPNQFGLVELPGISPDLVSLADEAELDITAPPLAALITYLINNGYTNPFGYPYTECLGGLWQLRRGR